MILRSALALLLAPAAAGAFELEFPLDCTLGDTCYIQQYVDHDPGPAARDFTCGSLSYEAHEGTDFALPSLAAMAAGVEVRASAAGRVRGIRDGMPDIAANDSAAPALEGRDCGNGVAITHEGGWETQYCHMKQGSLLVRPGQDVAAGTPLGQVGLSGRTEFPHLHVTLRQGKTVVDPFAPGSTDSCGPATEGLWQVALPYQPGGIISLGFASEVPGFAAVRAGTVAPPTGPDAPALVLWAYLFGGRAGDVLRVEITGPEGKVIAQDMRLEKTQAQLFRALGKRLRAATWPQGSYDGQATLLRNGATVDSAAVRLDL
ncbi:Peptidase family M23 [Gemmobacter aquatilis]|uniref:Peptidase family M23 n=1 Tax=Gemmobacter aquatilis TaxID=933059 RepID=A0A1H8J732_9RHOB|nr:M23 family metallopeptidase [Gemmobacter aquatilis]SEN75878.1 Peptidase family M23 [Gemmobacter aquatilis]